MSDERKVIQIAVAMAAVGEGDEGGRFNLSESENLYALDSTGGIWQWVPGNALRTTGWIDLEAPWNAISESMNKKKERKSDATRIAEWLQRMGDNYPDVPSELAQRILAGEWNA